MCTLSFAQGPAAGDWTLFFNRDESRRRPPEVAPSRYAEDGVQCIAPTDSAAGGTWITANAFGLSVALLNGYVATRGIDRGEAFRTRGELVRAMGASRSLDQLAERLEARDLSFYRPFLMFAVGRDGVPQTFSWDGQHLKKDEKPQMPLASSAAVQDEAKASRKKLHAELVGESPNPDTLDRFHRDHSPERGALSPCMHREDACTRSLIRIDKNSDRIVMTHEAGAPCQRVEPTSHELPLTAHSVS